MRVWELFEIIIVFRKSTVPSKHASVQLLVLLVKHSIGSIHKCLNSDQRLLCVTLYSLVCNSLKSRAQNEIDV